MPDIFNQIHMQLQILENTNTVKSNKNNTAVLILFLIIILNTGTAYVHAQILTRLDYIIYITYSFHQSHTCASIITLFVSPTFSLYAFWSIYIQLSFRLNVL